METSWLLCFLSLLVVCGEGSRIVEWDLNTTPLCSSSSSDGAVDFLEPKGHSEGYFFVNGTENGHLFYLYFENRNDDPDAPLLFWTNGGPGCSSFIGLFLENGSYKILDDLSLCWNPYGWDTTFNIIFVDHPLDVGYSYGSVQDKVVGDEQVSEHMLQFFYAFYKEHPEVRDKPLFLSGESHAGHYLPAIANRIIDANEEGLEIHISLAGIALGNPWTNPSMQYRSYPMYGYVMGLIDRKTKIELLDNWKVCDEKLQSCYAQHANEMHDECRRAYLFCHSNVFLPIVELRPTIEYYDIRRMRQDAGWKDMIRLSAFMNQREVKKRFQIPQELEWKRCNLSVTKAMEWEKATDATPLVTRLLEKGVPVLIYVGDKDLVCNFIGNRDWVEAMEWNGAKEWKQAAKESWLAKGKEAGEIQTYGLLTFLKIKDSGHMVPYDQPDVSLEMIRTFTDSRKTWNTVSRQKVHNQLQR